MIDVGLPGGLNGRQVADAGRVTRPDLKVLFIIGCAEDAAVGNGLLAFGMEVIASRLMWRFSRAFPHSQRLALFISCRTRALRALHCWE